MKKWTTKSSSAHSKIRMYLYILIFECSLEDKDVFVHPYLRP